MPNTLPRFYMSHLILTKLYCVFIFIAEETAWRSFSNLIKELVISGVWIFTQTV